VRKHFRKGLPVYVAGPDQLVLKGLFVEAEWVEIRPGVLFKTVHYKEMEFHQQRRLCMDCREPFPESPVLTEKVWRVDLGFTIGITCVPCIEKRLGRELTQADLKPNAPINEPWLKVLPPA